MSTSSIELCLNLENLEEKEYNRYITLRLSNIFAFVVDPYMININDLTDLSPGEIHVIRARRPAWGSGNLNKYIFPIRSY